MVRSLTSETDLEGIVMTVLGLGARPAWLFMFSVSVLGPFWGYLMGS